MLKMLRTSIIVRSKQAWKLVVGFTLLAVGFAVMVLGVQGGEAPGKAELALVGMVIIGSGGVWACLSIRCRVCGMRWLWSAVRNEDHRQWLNWLMAQRVCPRCGDDATTASSSGRS